MHVAVGIPQRVDGVAVVLRLARLEAAHHRVLAVDILQNIGVDEQVVECGIEDRTLLLGPALNLDDTQSVLPLLLGS